MRTFGKLAMALTLAVGFGGVAKAQGPGGRGGMGMGGGMGAALLSNKDLHKELKLSEKQVEELDKAATEMREQMMEKFAELRDLDPEERQPKMQALQKEMAAETKKVVGKYLKPEQEKRFHQISLQAQGMEAFANPEIQKTLKMTEDQKTKVTDMTEEARSQMREIMQGSRDDRQGAQKKMAEMRKEMHAKAMGMLTSEQKTMWKEMTGEPYELKMEARGPRGGGL